MGTVCLLCNEYANYRGRHNFCCTRSFSLTFEVCIRSAPWLVQSQGLSHHWNGWGGTLLPPIKRYEIGGKLETKQKWWIRGKVFSSRLCPWVPTLRYQEPDLLRLLPPELAPIVVRNDTRSFPNLIFDGALHSVVLFFYEVSKYPSILFLISFPKRL